ncbi:hypothetical protein ACN47E_008035 [Coniothyrium glycines]
MDTLRLARHHEHICTHPDRDLRVQNPTDDPKPWPDNNGEAALVRSSPPDPRIEYTLQPTPPATRLSYSTDIYTGTTRNPAVFLGILRIAQKNLPFLNLDSALQHVPNVGSNDALPDPQPGTFLDDHAWRPGRAASAEMLSVSCLPRFYSDGRHALGYYTLSASGAGRPGQGLLRTALFTPCTTEELLVWDLLVWGEDKRQQIAVREGRWVGKDVVEEYEEWSRVYKVVAGIWETRMAFTMGKGQDGGRWKT